MSPQLVYPTIEGSQESQARHSTQVVFSSGQLLPKISRAWSAAGIVRIPGSAALRALKQMTRRSYFQEASLFHTLYLLTVDTLDASSTVEIKINC